MEFLYQHGNDKHLVIRHWNANNQIAELSNDGDPKHAKLAQVLRDELNVNSNFNDIQKQIAVADLTDEQVYDIITLLSNQAKKIPLNKFKEKPISFDLKGMLS